jgi:hypothetical protein
MSFSSASNNNTSPEKKVKPPPVDECIVFRWAPSAQCYIHKHPHKNGTTHTNANCSRQTATRAKELEGAHLYLALEALLQDIRHPNKSTNQTKHDKKKATTGSGTLHRANTATVIANSSTDGTNATVDLSTEPSTIDADCVTGPYVDPHAADAYGGSDGFYYVPGNANWHRTRGQMVQQYLDAVNKDGENDDSDESISSYQEACLNVSMRERKKQKPIVLLVNGYVVSPVHRKCNS